MRLFSLSTRFRAHMLLDVDRRMDRKIFTVDDYRKHPVRVGFYEIQETIGTGNFAVVKIARHRITKSRVAIKIVDKSRLDQNNLDKVYREVRIMKCLQHPNILKLYQVMETTNMLYIVTEYCEKGEMFKYIDQHGKFSESEARKIFVQIFSAVEYCHNRAVVHRDLKTENLLLDENGNVKIADFGFGNYTDPSILLKTWCGSPPYAAPEIFEGKEYDGPAIDVWSLGVVLYVLVCAALPFDGETVHEVRDRVLEGRFRVPFYMSSDLEDLIRKILVRNPAHRFTLNQIKGHSWLRDHIPVTERPSTPVLVRNNSELNYQILQLMQSLGIDVDKTKSALFERKYDHYCAIYYLLSERLRRHRTSYPDQKNVGTRLRRASVMADQVIIKNDMVEAVVGHQQSRLPQSAPRKNPHALLQYALNELKLGDVSVPADFQATNVAGCVREFIPPVPQPPSYTSRSMQYPAAASPTIDTVAEEEVASSAKSGEVVGSPRPQRQRARRSAVDAMNHAQGNRRHTVQGAPSPPPIGRTLYVPANHPLLHREDDEPANLLNGPNCMLPNGFRIEIVAPTLPPTESVSASTMNCSPEGHPPGLPCMPFGLRTQLAFQEGRRASDGVNAPFKHLLHKTDERKFLLEHEQLQRLYERSLSPDEIEHQQRLHRQFMSRTSQENCASHLPVPHACEWGTASPMSSQNELMSTLQGLHLRSQDMDVDDTDQAFAGPGPHRRQSSYRKLASGLLPQLIRRRRNAVMVDSPFPCSVESYEEFVASEE